MAQTYAFATYDDYEERWGAADEAQVSALLDDAGLMLRAQVAVDEADDMQQAALKTVSLNMAHRAMATSASGLFGASQADAQMGPFQQSVHYANPSGDLYISAAERQMLGIGVDWVASISARIEGAYGSNA